MRQRTSILRMREMVREIQRNSCSCIEIIPSNNTGLFRDSGNERVQYIEIYKSDLGILVVFKIQGMFMP